MNGVRVAYELPLVENADFSESSGIYVHRALLRKNHGETQIITSNFDAILATMTSDLQTVKLLLNISYSGFYSRAFTDDRVKNTKLDILRRLTFKNKDDLEILNMVGLSCFEYIRNQLECNYLHDPVVEELLFEKIQLALQTHSEDVKALHNLQKKEVKTDLYKHLLSIGIIAKAKYDHDTELLGTHLPRLVPLMNDFLLVLAIHSTLDVPSLQILQHELIKRLSSTGMSFSKLNKIIGTANYYKYLGLLASGKLNQGVKTKDENLSMTPEQLLKTKLLKDPQFMQKFLKALPIHQEMLESVQVYAKRVLEDPASQMLDSCIFENDSAYHLLQPDYYRDPTSALCTFTKEKFRFSYREFIELVNNSVVAGQFGSDFLIAIQRTLLNPRFAEFVDKSNSIEAKIFSRLLKSSSVRIESVWSKVEESVSFRQHMHRHLGIMSAFAASRSGSAKFWDAYEEYVRRLFEFQGNHQLDEMEKLIIFRMCICLAVSRKFKDVNLVNSGIMKFLNAETSPFELSKLIKFVGPHMTDFETVKQIVHRYTSTLAEVSTHSQINKDYRSLDHMTIKRKIKEFKTYQDKKTKHVAFKVSKDSDQPPK